METKSLLGVLAVLLVVLAGIFYFVDMGTAPGEGMPMETGKQVTYEWRMEGVTDAEGVREAQTYVSLVTMGNEYRIGTFDGSCFVIEESSWTLVENEKSGVICWWAGGGSEIGVFDEGGKLVLKQGSLEEGDAETPGFRGDFQTFLEL